MYAENLVRLDLMTNRLTSTAMVAFLLFLLNLLGLPFKSKSQLQAENAALRQEVIVLQRKVRGRVQLTDRQVSNDADEFVAKHTPCQG